jgi:hypothetical protein
MADMDEASEMREDAAGDAVAGGPSDNDNASGSEVNVNSDGESDDDDGGEQIEGIIPNDQRAPPPPEVHVDERGVDERVANRMRVIAGAINLSPWQAYTNVEDAINMRNSIMRDDEATADAKRNAEIDVANARAVLQELVNAVPEGYTLTSHYRTALGPRDQMAMMRLKRSLEVDEQLLELERRAAEIESLGEPCDICRLVEDTGTAESSHVSLAINCFNELDSKWTEQMSEVYIASRMADVWNSTVYIAARRRKMEGAQRLDKFQVHRHRTMCRKSQVDQSLQRCIDTAMRIASDIECTSMYEWRVGRGGQLAEHPSVNSAALRLWMSTLQTAFRATHTMRGPVSSTSVGHGSARKNMGRAEHAKRRRLESTTSLNSIGGMHVARGPNFAVGAGVFSRANAHSR